MFSHCKPRSRNSFPGRRLATRTASRVAGLSLVHDTAGTAHHACLPCRWRGRSKKLPQMRFVIGARQSLSREPSIVEQCAATAIPGIAQYRHQRSSLRGCGHLLEDPNVCPKVWCPSTAARRPRTLTSRGAQRCSRIRHPRDRPVEINSGTKEASTEGGLYPLSPNAGLARSGSADRPYADGRPNSSGLARQSIVYNPRWRT